MNIAWWRRFRHPQPRQVRRFDQHTVVLRQSRERWASAGHVPPGGRADILTPDSTRPMGQPGGGLMSGLPGGMRPAPIPDAVRRTSLREHGPSALHVVRGNHDLSARERGVGKIDVDVRLGELGRRGRR